MTTKQRILDEALTLFSERGYSAVYVGEIASAVGIKTPSLYKHFKSKQDIFNACVDSFYARMQEVRTRLHLEGTDEETIDYRTVRLEDIIQIANELLEFYLADPVAARFRRMLLIERYHDAQLNKMYEELFIDGAVQHEERIFMELIEVNVMKKVDSHLLALRFYSPIFYLLMKYDTQPERLYEAKQELTALVQDFGRVYGTEDAQK